MHPWLAATGRQIDNLLLEEVAEPDTEIGEDEQPLGIISPEACRIYGLAMVYGRKADQAMLDFRYSSNAERGQAESLIAKLKETSEILMKIFWAALRDEFNVWNKSVGLRKGWQAVCFEPKPPPPIIGLLGDLFSH